MRGDSRKRGVPIPDEIEVDDYICVTVYVPNDSEGRYLEAMSGALSNMGKWSYWEKEDQKRGARVAEIWREHNDLTMETAWLKGVFMTCTQLDLLIDQMAESSLQISNAIRALELTTAPIDCLPCGERVEVPPNPTQDPDPENPPDGSTPQEWQDYLCRASNFIWYEHVMRGGAELVYLNNIGAGAIGVGVVIAVLYASGIGAPIAFVGSIIAAIFAIGNAYTQTEFEQELESISEEMICAMSGATGSDSALSEMRSVMISNNVDQSIIDYVMQSTGTNAMNKLYNGDVVVPDEFIEPHTCICAPVGSTPFDILYDWDDGQGGNDWQNWSDNARCGMSGAYPTTIYFSPNSTNSDASIEKTVGAFRSDLPALPVTSQVWVSTITIELFELNPALSPPFKTIEVEYTNEALSLIGSYVNATDTNAFYVKQINDFVTNDTPSQLMFSVTAKHHNVNKQDNEWFCGSIRITGYYT